MKKTLQKLAALAMVIVSTTIISPSLSASYTPSAQEEVVVTKATELLWNKFSGAQFENLLIALDKAITKQASNERVSYLLTTIKKNLLDLQSDNTGYYSQLKNTDTYYFEYNEETDEYIATIAPLNAQLIMHTSHSLRSCEDSSCSDMLTTVLENGFVVEGNTIIGDEGNLIFMDKSNNEEIDSLIKRKYMFKDHNSCQVMSYEGMDSQMNKLGYNVYDFDLDTFMSSDVANSDFHGGRLSLCTPWEGQVWYTPDYSDRYIDAQVGTHSLGWINGGIKIRYTD